MCLQMARWVTNSVDPDQMHITWHLIWVYIIWSCLSVWKLRINMEHLYGTFRKGSKLNKPLPLSMGDFSIQNFKIFKKI